MTDWYDGDPELFVPASDVYPRLRSLERRFAVLLGSAICSWLLVLVLTVEFEREAPAASKGNLLSIEVPKGR